MSRVSASLPIAAPSNTDTLYITSAYFSGRHGTKDIADGKGGPATTG